MDDEDEIEEEISGGKYESDYAVLVLETDVKVTWKKDFPGVHVREPYDCPIDH